MKFNQRKQRKFRFEKNGALILLKHFKTRYSSDYITVKPYNESLNLPDVDVVAVSKSKNFPELNLQLREDRKRVPNDILLHFDYGLWQFAIKDKTLKYERQGKDVSECVLVIQGLMSQQEAREEIILKRSQYWNSKFKGIYYVGHPQLTRIGSKMKMEEGFVIPIKAVNFYR